MPGDDQELRNAAFREVQRLADVNGDLTGRDLRAGFELDGQRIPLINPQRGIFKPTQMRFLLSIRTVYPRPGARVWYDDQRQVHRQIYEGDEAVDYAFMGQNADAAENRWLREAMQNGVPIIYFLGTSPGIYKALIPSFVIGWDAASLKARIAFSAEEGCGWCRDRHDARKELERWFGFDAYRPEPVKPSNQRRTGPCGLVLWEFRPVKVLD